MNNDRSTLAPTEWHPCASFAMDFIRTFSMKELMIQREALASCAIEGNRMAEVCLGTLNRLIAHQPVSDRYLLDLAWYLKTLEEKNNKSSCGV